MAKKDIYDVMDEITEKVYKLKKHGYTRATCMSLAFLISFSVLHGKTNGVSDIDYADPRVAAQMISAYDLKNERLIKLNNLFASIDSNTFQENFVISQEGNLVYEEENTSSEMSIDEKVNYILEKYNLTPFQFKVLVSVVYNEAAKDNYDDCYRVINTIYNRTINSLWVDDISKQTGIDGRSLYAQVIASNPVQFEVYNPNTSGYDYDEIYGSTAHLATIDFLIKDDDDPTKRIHDYLSFRSNNTEKKAGWQQFTDNGNIYFGAFKPNDFISPEYSYVAGYYDNGYVLQNYNIIGEDSNTRSK